VNSNQDLKERSGRSIHAVRQMSYCLKKMGLIEQVGKHRNQHLFKIIE